MVPPLARKLLKEHFLGMLSDTVNIGAARHPASADLMIVTVTQEIVSQGHASRVTHWQLRTEPAGRV